MGQELARQALERGRTGGFLSWDGLEHTDWQGAKMNTGRDKSTQGGRRRNDPKHGRKQHSKGMCLSLLIIE